MGLCCFNSAARCKYSSASAECPLRKSETPCLNSARPALSGIVPLPFLFSVGSSTNHERIPQSYGLRYSKSTDLAYSSETLNVEETGYSDVGPTFRTPDLSISWTEQPSV